MCGSKGKAGGGRGEGECTASRQRAASSGRRTKRRIGQRRGESKSSLYFPVGGHVTSTGARTTPARLGNLFKIDRSALPDTTQPLAFTLPTTPGRPCPSADRPRPAPIPHLHHSYHASNAPAPIPLSQCLTTSTTSSSPSLAETRRPTSKKAKRESPLHLRPPLVFCLALISAPPLAPLSPYSRAPPRSLSVSPPTTQHVVNAAQLLGCRLVTKLPRLRRYGRVGLRPR